MGAVEGVEVSGNMLSEVLLPSEVGAIWDTELGLLECKLEASFFCRLPNCDCGCVFGDEPPSSPMSMSLLSSPMSEAGLLMAGEDDRRVRDLKSSLTAEEDLSRLCCISRRRGRRQRRLGVSRTELTHRMRTRRKGVDGMLELRYPVIGCLAQICAFHFKAAACT